MHNKPTYEELKIKVTELEEALAKEKAVATDRGNDFRTIFEQAGEAILLHDLQGRLVNVNRQACDMLAYTREELLNMSVSDIDLHFSMPDDKLLLWDDLSQHDAFTVPRTHSRKDGTTFPVEVCMSPVELAEEKYVLAMVRDVNERKQSEQAFMSDIAHEINNILGIISGNTELALDDVPEETAFHFNLNQIKTASLRAKAVVGKLTGNIRTIDYKRTPISIDTIIDDAVKLLRGSIPLEVDIRRIMNTVSDTILVDPLQINQVILTLGVNVSRGIDESRGTLEIQAQNVSLRDESASIAPYLKPGNYVEVRISCTGQRLSSPMQGSETSLAAEGEINSIGIKLSLADDIVKSHGGAVVAASRADENSVYLVYLPVVEDESKSDTNKTTTLPGGDETILLVDDEESIVDVAREMLERLGYRVQTKTDPLEALELFRSGPDSFDLLITDLIMPNMTGSSFVRKILHIREDIPIILCTGYRNRISDATVKELGIKAIASKPFGMIDFAATVRQTLDARQ